DPYPKMNIDPMGEYLVTEIYAKGQRTPMEAERDLVEKFDHLKVLRLSDLDGCHPETAAAFIRLLRMGEIRSEVFYSLNPDQPHSFIYEYPAYNAEETFLFTMDPSLVYRSEMIKAFRGRSQ